MGRSVLKSLALHALLVLALILGESLHPRGGDTGTTASQNAAPAKPLQVRSVTEDDLRKELAKALKDTDPEKQIAQGDDSLKSETAPKAGGEKIYLSKNNQIVDKNTRAARYGKFKNVLKEGVKQPATVATQATKEMAEQKVEEKTETPSLKQLMSLAPSAQDLEQEKRLVTKTGRLRTPASVHAPDSRDTASTNGEKHEATGPKGDGESATDDYLRDVAVGANTLLNAQEFVFYSFYERIREKLSHSWHATLDDELTRVLVSGRTLAYDRRTKVEVELDPRGQLQEVKVIGSSGYAELDRAATDAFRVAAPFPNPPQGMVEPKTARVSIRWDFIVVADTTTPGVHVRVQREPAGF